MARSLQLNIFERA